MLGVDERDDAAHGLGLSQDFERERGLAGGLGAVDLYDAATGNASDAQRGIKGERARGDGLDLHAGSVVSEPHDGALAELLDNLVLGCLEDLLALLARGGGQDLLGRSLGLGHVRSLAVLLP